jgi:hypothetical protein
LIGRGAPQQQVNQICRKLESRGDLVRRARPNGRIGNYPPAGRVAESKDRAPAEAPTNDELRWSVELPFERQRIQRDVPHRAGVYQIMQSEGYPRSPEATRVLKIGKADKNLGDELRNHFQRHIAANRLTRIRNRFGISVTVVLVETSSEVASTCAQPLLRSFEDRR